VLIRSGEARLVAIFGLMPLLSQTPPQEAATAPDVHVSSPETVSDSTPSTWNSLEVAKLLTDIAIPLTIVGLGFWLNRRLTRLEHRRWTSQKVIEKRIEVFDKSAPLLNDLFCYFTRVGGWKEKTPPDIVALKRDLDRIIHVHAPIFPQGFGDQYRRFINNFFRTFTGPGQNAKLKATFGKHKSANSDWNDDWEDCFDEEKATTEQQIRKAYSEFMEQFSIALEIGATVA